MPDGRGGTCHAPIITFTDGATISFMTEETELGEYGTDIVYTKPPPRLKDEPIHPDCVCYIGCGATKKEARAWHQHADDPCPVHPDRPVH